MWYHLAKVSGRRLARRVSSGGLLGSVFGVRDVVFDVRGGVGGVLSGSVDRVGGSQLDLFLRLLRRLFRVLNDFFGGVGEVVDQWLGGVLDRFRCLLLNSVGREPERDQAGGDGGALRLAGD
jgi:hypothetical protein